MCEPWVRRRVLVRCPRRGVGRAVDRPNLAGSDDLDFFDELLDDGFALRGRAVVEDLIDVISQHVEFVIWGMAGAWLSSSASSSRRVCSCAVLARNPSA